MKENLMINSSCLLSIAMETSIKINLQSNISAIFISTRYTQYPITRNSDQRWALEFLKNIQFPDADRFFILQGWALAVS